jgi:hypothetical protein
MRSRGRAGALPKGLICLVLALVVFGLGSAARGASAATEAQASSANSAIQAAFVATYNAEKSGGNASSLVAKLNAALQLVQEAEAENSTSPALAATDLQNATAIAQSVTAESPSVARAGTEARQSAEVSSLGAASAIIVVAALAYAFGGRAYRSAWLRLHKDFVVRPANG